MAARVCGAALLLCGCGRGSPPPAPQARAEPEARNPEAAAGAAAEAAEAAPPQPAEAAFSFTARAKEEPRAAPGEIRAGMRRAELMAALGDCSERVYFAAGGGGQRSVEVFQPKKGDCRGRFGERRFTIIGDAVGQIEAGTREPFAAKLPPPPEHGAVF